MGVLVIERIEIPAEVIDRRRDFVDPGVAIEEAFHVVAGLDEVVVIVGDLELALFGEPQDVDLGFDPEVHSESHFRRLGEDLLGDTGVDRVGFAVEGVISRVKGDLFVPGAG